MKVAREVALHWMRAQEPCRWRWAEGATVLVREDDGATIVFREELEFILEGLAAEGFPSLGALVLALEIGGGSPEESFRRLLGWGQAMATGSDWADGAGAERLRALRDLVRQEPGLVNGSAAKRRFLAALFGGGSTMRVPPGDAREILELLRGGVEEAELESLAEGRGHAALALRELLEALARNPPEGIRRRLRTGLDRPLQPPRERLLGLFGARGAALERVPAPTNLLEALTLDARFAGLVRVARRVLAASGRPRRLRERAEQPMGGFSDVASRGSPDRLLVSELAYDADTFALRVANQEALYLRRERPPRDRTRDTVVLLDTGIHLWGLPRIFALAVVLALRERRPPEARFRLFVLREGVFREQRLETVAEVEELLGVLDPSPWPGEAVAAHLRGGFDPAMVDEWTLITRRHRDEELDALRRGVVAAGLRSFRLATVARTGEFRLRALNLAGGRELARAHLALESLLGDKPTAEPGGGAEDALPGLWPILYDGRPFPVPLTAATRADALVNDGAGGVLGLTRWGTVLHWPRAGALGRVLAEGLPPLRGLRVSAPRDSEVSLAGRMRDHRRRVFALFRVGLGGGTLRQEAFWVTPAGAGPLRSAGFLETALVLAFARRAVALCRLEGRVLDQLALPPGWREPLVFDGKKLFLANTVEGADGGRPGERWTLAAAPPGLASRTQWPMLTRLEALGNDGEGGLLLTRPGRRPKQLTVSDGTTGRELLLRDLPGGPPEAAGKWRFSPAAPPPGLERVPFARLVLPNGNTAWHDRRGLLTLQFSDPTEAEWTVLLAMGATLAWRSDGRWYGRVALVPERPVEGDLGELRLALRRWWGEVR
jgi:hypothetical protein